MSAVCWEKIYVVSFKWNTSSLLTGLPKTHSPSYLILLQKRVYWQSYPLKSKSRPSNVKHHHATSILCPTMLPLRVITQLFPLHNPLTWVKSCSFRSPIIELITRRHRHYSCIWLLPAQFCIRSYFCNRHQAGFVVIVIAIIALSFRHQWRQ